MPLGKESKLNLIRATSRGNQLQNILRGRADIARFLIGSDEPEEIIRQANMDYSGLAIPLAGVFFSNLHRMMSHWDEC